MPAVKKSALVPHTAEQIYNLVNDVESYPEFLPWCKSTRLISRTKSKVCGEIEVSRVGIRQKFATCNQLHPYERIDIQLLEGPFKHLQGTWHFNSLADSGCKVILELEFEFSGKLISKAFGVLFGQIANTMVDAFCKRARVVYRGG
ncbi:MAG: type II toxin-antitoxin system RatA family toxin [Gammaproteobacteria bacterium]|nr:type II toxin-antitoxin system RatA family toxin [Gammaproteobacteria bacterium]